MAGIFGCYNWKDSLQALEVCKILQQESLAGLAHTSEILKIANNTLGYAMRAQAVSPNLFRSLDKCYSVVLCGELFLPSGDELSLKNFETEFIPLFNRSKNSFFSECDGAYVLAIYDDSKKSLTLVTDPFSNLAIHYSITDNGFLFSSQQYGIAKALSKKMEDRAILDYLALGQSLDGKTFYQDILRLPPASCLTIDNEGKMLINKYYSPHYEKIDLDTKGILQHIETSLLEAVDMRTNRSGIAFGLTGGLDSRITLAALKRLGKTDSVTTLTHGVPDSYDMRIANRLAALYNTSHYKISFDEEFISDLPNYWREIVLFTEGALGIESSFAFSSWRREKENFDISMESHGGPLFRRQILKASESAFLRSNDFPASFFTKVSSVLLSSGLLRSSIKEEAHRSGLSNVREYFARQSGEITIGDRIDLYYLEQMCANRFSLSGNGQLNFIGLSHPLLTPKAYDAAIHIPSLLRKKNIVYRYLLNRFAPELKYIMVDNSGYPVPYRGYRALRYFPPVYEKILRMLPRGFHKLSFRKQTITHQVIAEKNFKQLKDLLLTPSAKFDELIIRKNLEAALSDFENKRKDNVGVLFQAANLKLILETFA